MFSHRGSYLKFYQILCHGALPVDMRRRSIKTMRKICSLNAIYPPAFLIPPGSVKVCNATQAACGGFGKVYRGELHGRAVAIKVANSDVMHMKSSFNDITGLFSGEAVIWRYLEHPNILPFYGVDTELFPMSCVSKWMAGGTIDVYLCNNQAENRIRLASYVAIGVARGLEYLHLHNIRHGDLKSRNIMVDETGEAYIGDFGAAQFAYPADTNSLSTASLSVGTAPWMPPEVFKAWLEEGQTYRQTTKVDIYSFAMVVWELFTGWIPFRHLVSSDMVSTLVMKGMRLKPRPPATIPLGLSDTIWELMQKCWSQDPEARPTAASIVVSLDGENWHARQLGTPSEWPLPLRYRRMESSSSGLIR
ncbi:hypothetical protein CERSUDRAFT_51530 [Gelatoporia subvermispora B]|uniref:Protein kinase domain-containing protein n=1 Tax=Ceriporiopsis subvermispora (strain B) TaxID=914234 RepID=M2QIA8_CERS8|nr:hypothetical protein CERSUDRAFT_51530 [Gelatoporia subvermispora B]